MKLRRWPAIVLTVVGTVITLYVLDEYRARYGPFECLDMAQPEIEKVARKRLARQAKFSDGRGGDEVYSDAWRMIDFIGWLDFPPDRNYAQTLFESPSGYRLRVDVLPTCETDIVYSAKTLEIPG